MRAAIFIDGAYLIKQLQEARVLPDYAKLAEFLLEPLRARTHLDLMRCYFYDCAPWASQSPTEDELRRKGNHERFVGELQDLDRWQVRLGKLERRRDGERDVFSQKRVDVQLSVDLVRHAAAGHIQHAVLVAGDSDFIPAVMAAKESGVTLTLWCGSDRSPHKDLMVAADEVQLIDFDKFPKKGTMRARSGARDAPQRAGAKDREAPAKAATPTPHPAIGLDARATEGAPKKKSRRRGSRGGRGRKKKSEGGASPQS